ncbi:S-layer family protein, partial [Flavobacterium sp. A45]|uniref:beta strand repeat-containing protein n=1 Tax=Flavobacterium sp. A45 TaxID=1945862 RepID=UPI0009C745BE
MNRILLTVVAFLPLQISTLKKVLLRFSPIEKENYVWLSTQTRSKKKGLSNTFGFLLVLLFICSFANAATRTASVSGNWSNTATWGGAAVPTSVDDVIINNGITVTVNVNSAVCKSLNISGTLTIGNNNTNRLVTVSGNVTVNIGGIFNSAGDGGNTLLISGNVVNDGTFDMNIVGSDADVTFNGSSSQAISGAGVTMDFNSITLTNAFPLVINRGITVDGNWTNNAKTVSGSGVVTFTGTSTIGGSTVTAFPNLIVTGTVTQGINTTVSGDFIINSGTYKVNNASSHSLTILGNYNQTGGVFDFNAGTSGTSNVYLAGNLTNTAGAGSISTVGAVKNGIITFNGSGIQILNMPTAGAAIWAKYVVNAGSTLKLASNLTLNSADQVTQADWVGELTVNGTVDFGAFQVSQSGGVAGIAKVNLNSGATLITANANGVDGSVSSTNITRTFDTAANYNFNGTVAQTTSAGMPATVNSLTMTNALGVTLSKATSVTANFSIGSGSVANLGTFTHIANTLTLGSFVTSAGSWGSTISAATNKNDTFFAATTGTVGITTTSCTTGNWIGVTSTDWNTASNWCGGIPTATTDVVILSGTPFSPNIASGTTALCRNLIVNASATLTLANSSSSLLNISGNFTNSGTFTAGTASVISFVGANQAVAGVTYSNLTLSGSGTKTFTSNTVISNLMSVSSGVVVSLNGITTHTAATLLLNGVNQIGGTWGATGSGATNFNNIFFTGTGRVAVPNNSVIDNDFASYGTTGDVAGTIGEYGGAFTLNAPVGSVLMNVKFASYGTPTGTSPNFAISSCHASSSKVNTISLLGNTSWSFSATNGVLNGMFGDPCVGTSKTYSVVATYSQPICADTSPGAITINGSTPTGGNGTYTYLWEISTTSATSGYATASGTSNGRDYIVPAGIAQTTWYRRTITSGAYTSNTIVIVQVNKLPSLSTPTVAAISGTTTICAGASTTLTVSGGSLSGYPTGGDKGGYAEWFLGSCGGTLVGTGNSITVSPGSTTTYYVRYTNSCGSTASCISQVVTVTSPVITAPTASSVCSGSTYTSGAITSTGATFDWSRAGVANINAGAAGVGGTNIAKATGFSEVLTNSTAAAINVTYVLTPKSASGCSGTPYNLVITVNPTVGITITAPTASSVCSGSTYTSGAITLTGATFDWSRAGVANINAGAAGVGGTNIAKATGFSEVLTNSTAAAINVTYVLTPKSASGCSGTPYNLVITVTPTVTINAFSPATSTRCQVAGTVTTTTTANNSTGITYSLDATTAAFAGNSIVAASGAVTYAAGWSGTTTITASAAGCNGPVTTTHVVTITPTVTINAFSPATSTRCQGAGTVTTTTTANNSTGITYSLDATTAAFAGNSIVAATGAVTYAAGWSGTTTITASAAGCNGPATTTHVVTIT